VACRCADASLPGASAVCAPYRHRRTKQQSKALGIVAFLLAGVLVGHGPTYVPTAGIAHAKATEQRQSGTTSDERGSKNAAEAVGLSRWMDRHPWLTWSLPILAVAMLSAHPKVAEMVFDGSDTSRAKIASTQLADPTRSHEGMVDLDRVKPFETGRRGDHQRQQPAVIHHGRHPRADRPSGLNAKGFGFRPPPLPSSPGTQQGYRAPVRHPPAFNLEPCPRPSALDQPGMREAIGAYARGEGPRPPLAPIDRRRPDCLVPVGPIQVPPFRAQRPHAQRPHAQPPPFGWSATPWPPIPRRQLRRR
jgi:hypothetical protein